MSLFKKLRKYLIFVLIVLVVTPLTALLVYQYYYVEDIGITQKPEGFVELITPNFTIYTPDGWNKNISNLKEYEFVPSGTEYRLTINLAITDDSTLVNAVKYKQCENLDVMYKGESDSEIYSNQYLKINTNPACIVKNKIESQKLTSWRYIIQKGENEVLFAEVKLINTVDNLNIESDVETSLRSIKVY